MAGFGLRFEPPTHPAAINVLSSDLVAFVNPLTRAALDPADLQPRLALSIPSHA